MIISVLVELSNQNIDKTFDYLVPESLIDLIKIGIRVKVPFNNYVLEGFVLAIKKDHDSSYELKEVISVIDEDIILNDELLELGKYIQKMTISTLISSYQVMLPTALKARSRVKINTKSYLYYEINVDLDELSKYKFNDKQKKIIELIKTSGQVKREELQKISLSSLNNLLKKNIIKKIYQEIYRLNNKEVELKKKYPLTIDQQQVVDIVLNHLHREDVYLLHGITGSGKTEVYMEIIETVINDGMSAIVLVPEISLTPQIIDRFKSRFGSRIAVLHSRLSNGEKYDEWRRIYKEEVDIVIGARSAVFAPLSKIGVIIVDEEHTTTYKQDNMPRYSAIDIAKKRGIYHHCPVILGSATPTIESYARSKKGVYKLLELPNRVNGKCLPEVTIIDLNHTIKKNNSYFSQELVNEMNVSLQKGEQVILLLNRRGYSSFVTCQNCGYVEKCPHCEISLTYHKTNQILRCHYCGYATKKRDVCPTCHENSIKDLGIGTEKVEEELNHLFSGYKTVRMDFDTTSRKGMHEKIINDFKDMKYQILLGTQMIAKGLDFPSVTLVGVINADTSLNIPDFRSSEYTFQLLNQVAGRSGRNNLPGKVIIQTFNQDHYAIKFAKDYDYQGFYNYEMQIRRELKYPPFYYLVSVRILSKDYELAKNSSLKTAEKLKKELTESLILGPSMCNVFKINNVYRLGIIIKYKKEDNLYQVLNELVNHYKSNSKVKIEIDFNPNYL